MKISQWHAAGRARWPSIELELAEFSAFVAPRQDASDDLAGEDLYLACACTRGQPAALAAFRRDYEPHIRAIVGRLDGSSELADDVLSQLEARLFVSAGDAPGKIATYTGRGPLLAFVRAASIRLALTSLRARGKRPGDDRALPGLVDQSADPELAYLQRIYRDEFRQAFEAAVSALSPESTLLLRLAVVDELSIDRIGTILSCHRATAARRIARARAEVVDATQANLRHKLGVDRAELESILRLVKSQADVSVRRLLAGD